MSKTVGSYSIWSPELSRRLRAHWVSNALTVEQIAADLGMRVDQVRHRVQRMHLGARKPGNKSSTVRSPDIRTMTNEQRREAALMEWKRVEREAAEAKTMKQRMDAIEVRGLFYRGFTEQQIAARLRMTYAAVRAALPVPFSKQVRSAIETELRT